eukprot:IDg15627t1
MVQSTDSWYPAAGIRKYAQIRVAQKTSNRQESAILGSARSLAAVQLTHYFNVEIRAKADAYPDIHVVIAE